MVSEKPLRILRRMGADEATIAAMDDIGAWRLIYANRPRPVVKAESICFTGFSDAQKSILERDAVAIGLRVTGSVSSLTRYLCTGPNAGPAKRKKATEVGSKILELDAFYEIVATGVLP